MCSIGRMNAIGKNKTVGIRFLYAGHHAGQRVAATAGAAQGIRCSGSVDSGKTIRSWRIDHGIQDFRAVDDYYITAAQGLLERGVEDINRQALRQRHRARPVADGARCLPHVGQGVDNNVRCTCGLEPVYLRDQVIRSLCHLRCRCLK